MPEPAAQARLDAAIADYAGRCARASFTAHLTLASGADPAALSEAALEALAARLPPLTLERDGLLATDAFTRAFALRFRPTAELLALRHAVRALAPAWDDGEFVPHVSLTYGAPPPDRAPLEALAEAFASPLRFDAIESARHGATVTTQADIAALAPGRRHPLRG
jgi:2'-5' RNA ligase